MNLQLLQDIYTARKTSIVLLLCLLLINAGLYIYLSQWQRPALESAQKEWFAKREAHADRRNGSSAAAYAKAVTDLAEFRKRLIAREDFPAFIGRLYAVAKGRHLALNSIAYHPAPLKEDPTILAYGITFAVAGPYPAVKGFMSDLARLPQMVTLDSVSLGNGSRTSEEVALNMSLTVYLDQGGAR
ncbi:hypothetical protein GMSM_31770 [Geomonas sp. Red276]